MCPLTTYSLMMSFLSISKDLKKLFSLAQITLLDIIGVSWMWTSNVITGKVKGDPKIIFMALEYAKLEDERRVKVLEIIERNRKELQKNGTPV